MPDSQEIPLIMSHARDIQEHAHILGNTPQIFKNFPHQGNVLEILTNFPSSKETCSKYSRTFSRIWNAKFHYRVNKSSLFVHFLRQTKPVYQFPSLFSIHFNIILRRKLLIPSRRFPACFFETPFQRYFFLYIYTRHMPCPFFLLDLSTKMK
jgi:hypothetical protein